MDPISDFSAAPHLPLSLRGTSPRPLRPELVLTSLTPGLQSLTNVAVVERNGEIYIEFATAA